MNPPRYGRRQVLAALIGGGALAGAGLAGCRQLIPTATPAGSAAPTAGPVPARVFAVASDPWAVRAWATQMGVMPGSVMEFEAWNRDRTLDTHFAQAQADGMSAFLITWEPWRPTAANLGITAQYNVQPTYTNKAIATGALDDYITRFARSVAAAKGLTVYMRFAHEMNGDWYPWSHDPVGYIAAWRHMVGIFRAVGATNTRFVFSVNPSPYVAEAAWLANIARYWPGPEYVDQIGTTMINFGGRKEASVADFAVRLDALRKVYPKDILLAEVDTAQAGHLKWLTDLRTWVAETPWCSGVVWSQTASSRGAAQLGSQAGDLDWDVTTDMSARPVLQALIHDLQDPSAAG